MKAVDLEKHGYSNSARYEIKFALLPAIIIIPILIITLDPKDEKGAEDLGGIFILMYGGILLTLWALTLRQVDNRVANEQPKEIQSLRQIRLSSLLIITPLILVGCYSSLVDWPEEPVVSWPSADWDIVDNSNGTYSIFLLNISEEKNLLYYSIELYDTNEESYYESQIHIEKRWNENIIGIESNLTWDLKNPDGDSDLSARAYDVEHETSTCNGTQEENGTFPIVFYDLDLDNNMTVGDWFLIRGNEYDERYQLGSSWVIKIKYRPYDTSVGVDVIIPD